ncbi:MFS transporter [Paraflavitalea sp. CAU 1676]|uniref:MFS transporter n=1 Tax=Paraflavitalea sp. CAU 1676 TaxID=3032598 RepID=UPI0023DA5A69|nr:MFS transporter [Paraflavitalea sp. CAU 1676]MDF2187625.1 MFS transporter [Paraflavitalea sp. CAU 1676]
MSSYKPLTHRIAASCFFFVCGFIFATWASRIPAIKDQFHLNEAELGAVLFMLPLGALVALPLAGWAVSVLGSRLINYIAAITYAIVLLLIGYSHSVALLSASLFFFGFCGNVLNISMNTQALLVQEEMYDKSLLSSFHGLWSIGAMIGAALGGYTMKTGATTRGHFLIVAGIVLVLSTMAVFYTIRKGKPAGEQKIFAWPDKTLWLLGAICFCCAICEGAMADWSSLFYKQVLNDLKRVSTTGYMVFACMMALGRLIGDVVIGRLSYKGALVLDGILITIGLIVATTLAFPVAVIIGFGLIGFGVATVIPIVYSLSAKTTTMSTSAALAAVSTVGFSGFLVGPPMIGFIAHQTGLRYALMLLSLLGIVILWLCRKVKN